MLTSYFNAQGYKVTAVGWGNDALAFVEKTIPDLIMLDIRLPDIDGYEICRRIRAHRRTEHIPIIFLIRQLATLLAHLGAQVGLLQQTNHTLGKLVWLICKQDILAIGYTITHPRYFGDLFFGHLQGVTVAFLIVFTLLSIYNISNGFSERHRL